MKREYNHEVNDEDLRKAVREACYEKLTLLPLPETITNTNVLLLSKLSVKNSKLNSLKKSWTKRVR